MRGALIITVLSALALIATRAGAQCICDCDGNGRVGVNDLLRMVSLSIAPDDIDRCPRFWSIPIQIHDLVSCVDAALAQTKCPTPTALPTNTDTAAATATPSSTPSQPPSPIPTAFPPADAAAATLATEIIDTIAGSVCQTGITPGGRFDVRSTPAGAHLECDSFTGHEGRFDLVKYPSTAAARDFLGEPHPDWSVSESGGGALRELRWVPSCCAHLGGESTKWAWQHDCWLASGNTFDDTHFVLTPQGRIVVDALVESGRLDELLALCGDAVVQSDSMVAR